MTIPASLTRLMNNVRVRCPGVVDDAIKNEMYNVLNKFFQNTQSWKEDIDFVTVVDEDTYPLGTSEPAQIDRLVEVVDSNGNQVAATMADDLENVILASASSQAEVLTATVALTVTDPVDGNDYPQYPDWLLVKYHDTILDGLLGELFSHKAKPYSDERLAIFHQRKFRNTMATARTNANRKNTYNTQNWSFPRFAPGNQR